MVTTMTTLPLASRVEAEASRELDAEIAAALQIVPQFDPSIYIVPLIYEACDDGSVRVSTCLPNGTIQSVHRRHVPPYSTSLDAAMTLLPEGWDWTLYADGSGEIYRDVPEGMLPGAPGSTVIGFEGDTPAQGLCSAALRARAGEAGR
jgi:hypothetical protein